MEKSRDIQTFNFLFTNYKRRFTHFARTYVDDEMTAEDIAVESLMYYWENREKLKEHTNIPAYVLTRYWSSSENIFSGLQASKVAIRKFCLRISLLCRVSAKSS